MIRLGVLGAGHWGPNLIRNFDNKLRSEVVRVVDLSQQRLDAVRSRFPAIETGTEPAAIFGDESIDAVVVATPTVTHYELVKQALQAGKHVMVEKPLTDKPETSVELTELAAAKNRVMLVGHIFVYNAAVQWVKQTIDADELGRIYYLSSDRTNLGPIRMDVNAAWDLAAQDIAIFNYWLDAKPLAVSARGHAWINDGVEDAVFATLRYADDVLVHLHVSWLNPRKVRDITVVADKKMLTYDDMNLGEPIRIYDKQVTEETVKPGFVDNFASFRASVYEGEVRIPRVRMGEPLRNECEHFLDCIEQGKAPLTGGPEALAVVETLAAMDRSMSNKGHEEPV